MNISGSVRLISGGGAAANRSSFSFRQTGGERVQALVWVRRQHQSKVLAYSPTPDSKVLPSAPMPTVVQLRPFSSLARSQSTSTTSKGLTEFSSTASCPAAEGEKNTYNRGHYACTAATAKSAETSHRSENRSRRGFNSSRRLAASLPVSPLIGCSSLSSTGDNGKLLPYWAYHHSADAQPPSRKGISLFGGRKMIRRGFSSSAGGISNVEKKTSERRQNANTESSAGSTDKHSDRTRGLTPHQVVAYLDKYVVGQKDAKKAVANALRNRWRRRQIQDKELQDDIMPKNILMIGPTGVGKTELARKLAKLIEAPFIKVEATKYTEVGFHGRDVETIIKDLVDLAVRQEKARTEARLMPRAQAVADEKILINLMGSSSEKEKAKWLEHLRGGHFDSQLIPIDLPFGVDRASDLFGSFSSNSGGIQTGDNGGRMERTERRELSVKDARAVLPVVELRKMINLDRIVKEALEAVEQDSIVFIDEIDKICTSRSSSYHGPDASAEGVQRDLLPLIEGTTVSTTYGNIKTDHVLFIASGAFHYVKPSDMMPELQGRLPVRVELQALTEEDFRRILTEPRNNLLLQHSALLKAEGVTLEFDQTAIEAISRVATEVNAGTENIGARRLITIIEKLMEDISFNAPSSQPGTRIVINAQNVQASVAGYISKSDLKKFIL